MTFSSTLDLFCAVWVVSTGTQFISSASLRPKSCGRGEEPPVFFNPLNHSTTNLNWFFGGVCSGKFLDPAPNPFEMEDSELEVYHPHLPMAPHTSRSSA